MGISTHVLDTSRGARRSRDRGHARATGGRRLERGGSGVTDGDGRVSALLADGRTPSRAPTGCGSTCALLSAAGVASFYPVVEITVHDRRREPEIPCAAAAVAVRLLHLSRLVMESAQLDDHPCGAVARRTFASFGEVVGPTTGEDGRLVNLETARRFDHAARLESDRTPRVPTWPSSTAARSRCRSGSRCSSAIRTPPSIPAAGGCPLDGVRRAEDANGKPDLGGIRAFIAARESA
jgi:hypothetical protein